MTPDEYWHGDPWLIRDYLLAEQFKRKRENQTLWLNGMYMAQAISSTIGNAFLAKGQQPNTYPERPLPIDEDSLEEERRIQEEESVKQAEAWMKNLVAMHNSRWDKEHGNATDTPPA